MGICMKVDKMEGTDTCLENAVRNFQCSTVNFQQTGCTLIAAPLNIEH